MGIVFSVHLWQGLLIGLGTRSKGDSAVFVLDAETSECLHYEPVDGHPKKSTVQIPREILAEHPELEIRNDLIDCCIDVCSAEVSHLRLPVVHRVGVLKVTRRSHPCSRITSTTLTCGETSSTVSSRPIF